MANAMQSPMVLVFNAPDMRPSDIIEEVILAMDHVR